MKFFSRQMLCWAEAAADDAAAAADVVVRCDDDHDDSVIKFIQFYWLLWMLLLLYLLYMNILDGLYWAVLCVRITSSRISIHGNEALTHMVRLMMLKMIIIWITLNLKQS